METPIRLEVSPSADLARQLPPAYEAPGMVSVTCLPHHGPARTVAASIELARLGYHVVPRLAARSIASQAELHLFLHQLRDEGVRKLFLIAGDRSAPAGPYSWSGQLMEDIKAFSEDFSLGIAGYPEGHPQLSAEQLRRRLGVGRSLKLARGTGMAKALLRGGDVMRYDSSGLIRDVHQALDGHPLFAGIHVYSFNDLSRLPRFEGKIAWLPKPPVKTSTSQS